MLLQFEPGWEGHVTLDQMTPSVKIYANEGVAQLYLLKETKAKCFLR